MKLEDFQSLKCSYPAHIPFSVHWSQDNCVAMGTGKGVYVTELLPSMSSKTPILNIRRHFLRCSTAMPIKNCGINVEGLMEELDQKGMYELIQDSTMSPKISKNRSTLPSVKQLAWSPLILQQMPRSMLAVLSDCGALNIYSLWRDSWIIEAIISDLWHEHCSSQWGENPSHNNELLKELKIRSYKIKISAFAWGNSKHKLSYELYVGTLDGTLSIWNIHKNISTRNTEAEFLLEHPTGREHITALLSQCVASDRYILFLCYFDGIITSLLVEYHENDIKISQEKVIWDEKDRLQVYPGGLSARICSGNNLTDSIVLQVVKGNYILILSVSTEGELKSYEFTQALELNLTGMVSLSETETLLTGYSGTIYRLNTDGTVPSLLKVQESVRTNNYACHGLAVSNSQSIAILPFSVKANYDHLAMKDLCHLTFCSLKDIPGITNTISKHRGSLNEIWDALEILRIKSILKCSSITWNRTPDELDTMENDELKKNLALLKLSNLLETIQLGSSSEDKEKLINEIQDLILSCNVFKRISCLMSDEELSTFDRKSLVIMKVWLEFVLGKYSYKYRHTATTASTLKSQLGIQGVEDAETCSICEDEVKCFTGPHTSICQRGHEIPRCSLTLVQCSDVPYYYCSKCNAIIHSEAVGAEHTFCVYCDNLLLLSEMVLNDEEMPLKIEETEAIEEN